MKTRLTITLLLVVLICSIHQCSTYKDRYNATQATIEALQDTMTTYRTKDGQLASTKQLNNTLEDSVKTLLRKLELSKKQVLVVTKVVTKIEPPRYDTCWVVSSLARDSVSIYHFRDSDMWHILKGEVKDSANASGHTLSLAVELNTMYVPLDFVVSKDGRAYVTTPNPYVLIDNLDGFVLPKERKKRFGVGLLAGVGGSRGGISPYVGVGISYNIFQW